jgi:hypothetical protein
MLIPIQTKISYSIELCVEMAARARAVAKCNIFFEIAKKSSLTAGRK